MPSRKQRRLQTTKKYDVALRIKNDDDLCKLPQSVDEIFSTLQKDKNVSTLVVCGWIRNKNTLCLRAHKSGLASQIKQIIPKITKLFEVDMELVECKYLFHVDELKSKTINEVNVVQLGENNGVDVVRFYRRSSKWLVELRSLEDAKELFQRGSIYLPGNNMQPLNVKPVGDDIHYIECFKCSGAGHYQDTCKSEIQICGKCGDQHETRICTLKETKDFRCPNCNAEDGKGHASYHRSCQNQKSKAEWKRADEAWEKFPIWLTPDIRALRQLPLQEQFLPEQDLPTAPAKRGRPCGKAPESRKKRRIEKTNTIASSSIADWCRRAKGSSSQRLTALSKSQDTDCAPVGSSFSSQEQWATDSCETSIEVCTGAEETMGFSED